MGKIQEMEEAAARWALARATKTELDPVLAEIAQLRAVIAQSLASTQAEEAARAERLRETIDPVLLSVQAAVDKIVTAISRHSGHLTSLQLDLEILRQDRSSETARVLHDQMAHLTQRLADLPERIGVHVVEAIDSRTTNPGTPSSNASPQNAAAIEQMDKARAFDRLSMNQQNQKALARILAEVRAEREREAARPSQGSAPHGRGAA